MHARVMGTFDLVQKGSMRTGMHKGDGDFQQSAKESSMCANTHKGDADF